MKQVKVTDKQSPLFGEVGFLLKQSNGDYHTVSIKNVHHQLHRLSFTVMNRYTPKVESEILAKVAVDIERVKNEIDKMKSHADNYNNKFANGASFAYGQCSEMLELILKG